MRCQHPGMQPCSCCEARDEDNEILEGQRSAALDALSSLVRYVQRVGGFMSAEDQATLRGARALLAELGRKL